MAKIGNNGELDAALKRAKARWLNAMTINAGGRFAVVPAALAALGAFALALGGYTSLAALAGASALALIGAALSLLLTRRAYSVARKPGAPDWSLALDREMGLNDSLITLLEDAGPFAIAMRARVAATFDEAKARSAAPKMRYGALAVALLLAVLPLALWQAEQERNETPASDEVAEASGGAEIPGAGSGSASGENGKGERGKAGKKPSDGSGGGQGDVKAEPKPAPMGAKSTGPGEKPPQNVKPTPSNSESKSSQGDVKSDQPQPENTPPEKKIDPKNLEITPDVTDGEKRAKDIKRWVYDEKGERKPGGDATGPNWKERAEDAIPRMNLTSRERKLLEEWFNKLGK